MPTRAALTCLLCFLVSACGGGGGGGNTPAPAAPFALTDATAVQAAAYALKPLEQLLPAESVVVNAALYMRLYNLQQWTIQCSATPPVSVTITYTDQDLSGSVTVGDIVNVPAVDCAGLRRRLTYTLTQLAPSFDQVAGRLEFDIEVDGMHLTGSLDASASYTATTNLTTWRMTNATVTLTNVGTTQTIRLTSGEFAFNPSTYTFTLAGGSVDSQHIGGSYTFATATPLAGPLRRLPTSGELLLSTSGGSRVRITPPSPPGTIEEAVHYAVAATSTGAFGPAQQTVWTAIVRGLLFGWRPNEAPTLTNLTIAPSNPSPGSSLYASYDAQDANGDSLQTTFEWRLNGTVVSNTQYFNAATVRGDQITLTVTVSDGRLSASSTASITIGNPSPVFQSLTLTPAQPNSAVDLVAVATVYEPDGDPVTLTYEWRRNGTVIANRTAATLPASETTRNDTISVSVRATDGASTVESTASTTILDAPALVSVTSPPTTVALGAPVTFTATVADPDGDPLGPLTFVLAYGPAGMTVNATTGVVTWTASGPMFDRSMSINWGITVSDSTAMPATGTLQVTASGHNYPKARFGTEIPTWPAGLSVADHDGDGDTEMLVMSQRWLFELESDGAGGYRQSWAYPYAFAAEDQYSYYSSRATLATGDVDEDGKLEIFASVGRTITKLDGVDRRPVATLQLPTPYETCADLAYTDLGNDGAEEIICLASTDNWASTARILILRATDLSVRFEFPNAAYGRSFAVGNVDTDPALEIVTAGGYVFDGEQLVNQWAYGPGFGMDVDTGDLDGNGVAEIVAAVDWTAVRAYSATLRSPLWEVARSDLDSLLVADIGGDARPEIIVGDGQWGNVTIYRYNTSSGAPELLDQINSQDHGVSSIGVGDVDGDGQREIVWGSGYSSSGPDVFVVAGRNPTLAVEWTNSSAVQFEGPFKGGALAGSPLAARAPLFFSPVSSSPSYGSRLLRMPANGPLEISAQFATNYARSGAISVVDWDNDGVDEAFIATHDFYDGFFTVYDFFNAASEWSSGILNQNSTQDVTHADLTGDGRADLIGLTSTGVVYVYDVFNSSVFWQSTTLNGGLRVLATDVDNNGSAREIVVITPQYVYLYRTNPAPVRFVQSAVYQTNVGVVDADVGDTDGDGDAEVVLLMGQNYSAYSSDILTLNSSLQSEGSFTLPWPAQTLDIEPSTAARKNLLVSRLLASSSDSTLAIVGSRSGGIVFESPPLIGAIQRDSVNYVTLPGETQQRISIGTSAGCI